MSNTRTPGSLRHTEKTPAGITPSRTPGSLGKNDAADPNTWSMMGDTPGPTGVNDRVAPNLNRLMVDILAAQRIAKDKEDADLLKAQEQPEVVLLAAVAFGEASDREQYEEMAAIASVIVRQRDSQKAGLATILGPHSSFAFAASDGNQRVRLFRATTPAHRIKNVGMTLALRAAVNALGGGQDYSNGAYFWDGADIASNYSHHPKVKKGIEFTKPEHNIYKIKPTAVKETTHWQVEDKHHKVVDGKIRGSYTHVYESTAAYGGTIFWKYSEAFLHATGNKEYQ